MEKLKILLLEDSKFDAELIREELVLNRFDFTYRQVDAEKDFINAIHDFKPDIILSDYNLPQFTGFEALEIAKELVPDIPFIIVTGSLSEETAVDSMKRGSWDYVIKENLLRLSPAIKNALKLKTEKDKNKQAEEKLIKLSAAVTQSPSIIVITDLEGNIEYVNPKFTELTKYTSEETHGENTRLLKSGEQAAEVYKELWTTISSGKEWRGELHNKKKNGELFWEDASISPIINNEGEIIKYLKVAKDITEHKKAEAELIAALKQAEESDRLKSSFLANMSHEIRTPMNGILGFSELLKEPGLSGEEQQGYIKVIESSGERMLNTINNLIEISKLEVSQVNVSLTKVNIHKQFEDICSFFKPEVEKKGLQIFCNENSPASELILNTDGDKFYGILTNLVKNAIKYTDEGSIGFGYKKKTNFIEFFVKDTGIGVPKERQQAIFNRFVQADMTQSRLFEGSGLGLSISKAYVNLLGGEIRVDSEVGKGSVFYFTIPWSEKGNTLLKS